VRALRRPRRRMLHPRSEPQIYGVLDGLCEAVRMSCMPAKAPSFPAPPLQLTLMHVQASTKLGQHYRAPCNRCMPCRNIACTAHPLS
jgi:hypothetical protein